MMTVKHVYPNGEEVVFEASHVAYVPPMGDNASYLRAITSGELSLDISGGKAYVMNDSGTTVATYSLPRNAYDEPKK